MIKGIAHIAFNVYDMDKAVDFYCNKLGFKEAFEIRNDKDEPWIKYIKIREGQFIELFYNGPAVNTNSSYSHLCLEVDDINAIADKLRANSIEITSGPNQGKDLNWQCWAADPDGNRIEFMQMNPESLQMKS